MSYHGGKREGAGRPRIGEARHVKITLPEENWKQIFEDKLLEYNANYLSDYIKALIEKDLSGGRDDHAR